MKSQRRVRIPSSNIFLRVVAEERLAVAHADVDRQCEAAFIQDILKRFAWRKVISLSGDLPPTAS